jgi:glutaredoxin
MKLLMKPIRWFVGQVILFINWLTWPKPLKRSDQAQQAVNQQAAHLSLYQFKACPFCVKVRRHIQKLNIPIEMREAKHEGPHRQALIAGGGKAKVPCLRIQDHPTDTWMYESNDIIAYLNERFAPHETTPL